MTTSPLRPAGRGARMLTGALLLAVAAATAPAIGPDGVPAIATTSTSSTPTHDPASAAPSDAVPAASVVPEAPSWGPTRIQVGTTSVVTGRVTDTPAAQVAVERYLPGIGAWLAVSTGTTDATGAYRLLITQLSTGRQHHRLHVFGATPDTDRFSETFTYDVALLPTRLGLSIRRTTSRQAGLRWSLGSAETRRTVFLQQREPGGRWIRSRKLQGAGGAHVTRVRPGFLGTFRYRLHAPATRTARSATSRAVKVRTRTPYRPAGSRAHHRLLFASGARWNPCAPIRYRVNLRHAGPGAWRDVRRAIGQVEFASGLDFVHVGRTSVVPVGSAAQSFGPGTDFVIAWARPGSTPLIPASQPDLMGSGGGVAWSGYVDADGRSASMIRRGQVVISTRADQRLRRGFGPGKTRGSLLMHELGHAVGLSHVDQHRQTMYPLVTAVPDRWGAGDLAGLSRVGASRGCLSRPGSPYARLGSGATVGSVPPASVPEVQHEH